MGPALGTAPARGPWGFRHHGTSRHQSPTSSHARCRAGNGEEQGRTVRAHNPATLPLKSPQQAAWHSPRLSQLPMARHRLENPTAKALLARPGAQLLARRTPAARGGSIITGPRGASSPPVAHARCRARNGEEGGRTLRARNPAMLPLKSAQQAAWHSPRLSQGPMAASPPRKSHSESFVDQTRGPALGTAPARGPWGFPHHGTSRRQSPTSTHARCRARNGEERGRTLHARNPATLPLKSPQQAAWHSSRLSQLPIAASPPRKSHSESFVDQTRGAALGTAPARFPWGFPHHGTSRRQSPTSAHARCRARNGKSGADPTRSQPRHAPAQEPPPAASRSPRLSQGPMVARCTLAGGHTAPLEPAPAQCSSSMFQLNARLRKLRFGRGGDVLGGEERRLLPSRFQSSMRRAQARAPGRAGRRACAQRGDRGRARHA